MKFHFPVMVTVGLLLGAVSQAYGGGVGWTQDFEAAKSRAHKEGKDLLLDFTGSDWCHWCIQLNEEVFSKEYFQKTAPDRFVLVTLDFPRTRNLPEEIKTQNQKLMEEHGIRGFPTIILTDANGKAFARTGYKEGGPEPYVQHLAELQNNKNTWQTMLADAKLATGLEKARLLDAAITAYSANGIEEPLENLIAQIKELDKDDEAGLRAKYVVSEKLSEMESELNSSGDFDKALRELDSLFNISRNSPETRQRIYLFQASIFLQGKNDRNAGLENLRKAVQAAPASSLGKRIATAIQEIESGE